MCTIREYSTNLSVRPCSSSGLRFLRLFYLLDLPDVLQLMHLLKNKNSIRLVQITTIFLSIWLASCGFVHIVSMWGRDTSKSFTQ